MIFVVSDVKIRFTKFKPDIQTCSYLPGGLSI